MAVNMAFAAITVASFVLAIGLVRALGRMIDPDPEQDPGETGPIGKRIVG